MLIITRRKNERILIGENVWLTVLDSRRGVTRLGIDAPAEVIVHREEIAAAIARDGAKNERFRNVSEPQPTA